MQVFVIPAFVALERLEKMLKNLKYDDEWVYLSEIDKLFNEDELRYGAINVKVAQFKNKKLDISQWYKKVSTRHKVKKAVMINVGYFKAIYNERLRIQDEAHKVYYKLLDMFNDDENKIIPLFMKYRHSSYQSVYEFIKYNLFKNLYDTSLTSFVISKQMYEFQQFGEIMLTPVAFDGVDEEYDYYEAIKIKKEIKCY